ncbi:PIN domain-containing protein [Nocardia cyriacigeorgica]|nr:PIN domain-containing protein [Nocardia cyriacigeorgica]MBF6455551.1 PIN domain-containing protein [Nocardia cyriacigeorgica]MBF6479593.1 PIN domain-containing protein [Nocardia cyriacigeorgica]MBF6553707.1 PIN domain-containing protein [Nocardia cyriacigeorgica]
MACVVVYDANVLYGNTLRDMLIRVARSRLVQAKWSDRILDEALQSLAARRPDIERPKLDRLRSLMNAAVPDSLVTGCEPLIEGLKLPDPDDRHVLAAAITCHATTIVTWNTADFPAESLDPWHVEARSPDDFLLEQISIDDRRVWACVQQIADSRRNPPETTEDVLDALERAGMVESVAALRSGR